MAIVSLLLMEFRDSVNQKTILLVLDFSGINSPVLNWIATLVPIIVSSALSLRPVGTLVNCLTVLFLK